MSHPDTASLPGPFDITVDLHDLAPTGEHTRADLLLGALGTHVWAVRSTHADVNFGLTWVDDVDVSGTLSTASLACEYPRDDARGEMALTWDGATLTVSFPHQGPVPASEHQPDVHLTPLSPAAEQVYHRWAERDPFDNCLAARVARCDVVAMGAALGFLTRTRLPLDPIEALDLLAGLHPDEAARLDHRVVAALAEHWDGTYEVLLATSLQVSADPVPG